MSDIQLLKDAAKAAGIELDWNIPPNAKNPWRMTGVKGTEDYGPACEWNPLTDDADALRLAVKLDLAVMPYPVFESPKHSVVVSQRNLEHSMFEVVELQNGDPYAETRRAIVRAAAEIGKTK